MILPFSRSGLLLGLAWCLVLSACGDDQKDGPNVDDGDLGVDVGDDAERADLVTAEGPDIAEADIEEPDIEEPDVPEVPLDQIYQLQRPVEVIIDDRGIPHFYGETDQDVFYAAGYQMAVDRLYHMAMTRRRAHGRMAEVLGESALADDELARIFDWKGYGRRDSARMSQENEESWGIVVAWVSGVNRRIDEIHAEDVPLPYGFGPAEQGFLPE